MNSKGIAFTATVLSSLIWNSGAFSAQNEDWQLAMLFDPSAAQLKIEDRGRVFIYDGIKSTDVQRVMDSQFHRLDNMMFIRTQSVNADGKVESEDDDC
ncbi:MAG: hypothetical protein WBN68_19830 [Sedimenticolaceae bacterium]